MKALPDIHIEPALGLDTNVIGIDPGGDKGVTGIVRCRGWSYDMKRWPFARPFEIETESIKGFDYACAGIADSSRRDVTILACEDAPAAQIFLKSTIEMVGAVRWIAAQNVCELRLATAQQVRSWLLGGKAEKGQGDRLVDQALLEAYGGKELAVGGRKCPTCKGKGWCGYRRPMCPECYGQGQKPMGPLYPLWKPKSLPHCRAALAVALYAINTDPRFQLSGRSES